MASPRAADFPRPRAAVNATVLRSVLSNRLVSKREEGGRKKGSETLEGEERGRDRDGSKRSKVTVGEEEEGERGRKMEKA
jgi:hypothetical protein